MNSFSKVICALLVGLFMIPTGFVFSFAKADNPVTEIDINITPKNYDFLTDEDNKKESVPALVSVDGSNYFAVSINTRGYSSFKDGQSSPSRRYPFEIVFDAYKKNSFNSNSSLKLNTAAPVYGLLSECTAHKMYEQMNIAVPSASPVFLKFNGVDFGLYTGVEDVNSEFIAREFSQNAANEGTLYRCVLEESLIKQSDCIKTDWFGTLRVKFGESHETLFAALDALSSGKDYEKYFDTDELMRYFAVTAATCNFDSLLNHFNNFYLLSFDGKLHIIPWDMGLSYYWYTESPTNSIFGTSEFFKLILSDENNRRLYYKYIEELRESFLIPEISKPYVEAFASAIGKYCLRDQSSGFDNAEALRNLTDGSYMINGNFALTLSEVYRQLGDQLSGKKKGFDIPTFSDDYYSKAESPQQLIPNLIKESFSPAEYYGRLLENRNYILLPLLLLPVAALLIYFVVSTLRAKRRY